MGVRIKVEGLDEIRRQFADAPKEMRKQLRAANKQAAQPVADRAKVLVPVRTGRLSRSIKPTATVKDAFVKAGGTNPVPYAGIIHFGHPRRHIRPQPFLYDAADQRLDRVYDAYERAAAKVAAQLNS